MLILKNITQQQRIAKKQNMQANRNIKTYEQNNMYIELKTITES